MVCTLIEMSNTPVLVIHRVTESGDVNLSTAMPPTLELVGELQRLQQTIADTPAEVHFVWFFQQVAIIGTVLNKQLFARCLLRKWYERVPEPFAYIELAPAVWGNNHPPTSEFSLQQFQPPVRSVATVKAMMPTADGPFLYGGCQALLDRAKIILERSEPDHTTIRQLWQLLPISIQAQTTFISWTQQHECRFDIMMVPVIPVEHPGYLIEDQARDYPESRYERALQLAIEFDDEASFQKLIHRQSSAQVLRLAFTLVLGMAVLSVVARILLR